MREIHIHEHQHDGPGHGGHWRGGRRRGPSGHGRQRARRGAVTMSILTLLAEQPRYGYELITTLEERSGDRWRPSPGAIYPALGKLESRGLIVSEEVDGKKQYRLTDEGRLVADKLAEHGVDAPWDLEGPGNHGELRRALAELAGPARQIARFGTDEQRTAAAQAIKEATASLYRILAGS